MYRARRDFARPRTMLLLVMDGLSEEFFAVIARRVIHFLGKLRCYQICLETYVEQFGRVSNSKLGRQKYFRCTGVAFPPYVFFEGSNEFRRERSRKCVTRR